MDDRIAIGQSRDALMELLIEGPCAVVDFLPERVAAESPGRFFEVEEHFLGDAEEAGRFAKSACRIVLKLACYFKIELFDLICGKWLDDVTVAEIADLIESVVRSGRGGVNVLLPEEGCLLAVEGGSFNLTAYGKNERFLMLLTKLAEAEGLFCWEGLDSD